MSWFKSIRRLCWSSLLLLLQLSFTYTDAFVSTHIHSITTTLTHTYKQPNCFRVASKENSFHWMDVFCYMVLFGAATRFSSSLAKCFKIFLLPSCTTHTHTHTNSNCFVHLFLSRTTIRLMLPISMRLFPSCNHFLFCAFVAVHCDLRQVRFLWAQCARFQCVSPAYLLFFSYTIPFQFCLNGLIL